MKRCRDNKAASSAILKTEGYISDKTSRYFKAKCVFSCI